MRVEKSATIFAFNIRLIWIFQIIMTGSKVRLVSVKMVMLSLARYMAPRWGQAATLSMAQGRGSRHWNAEARMPTVLATAMNERTVWFAIRKRPKLLSALRWRQTEIRLHADAARLARDEA